MESQTEPGQEALVYDPSSVSWAVSEAVSRPPSVLSRVGLYSIVFVLLSAATYAHLAVITISITGRGIVRTSEKVRPIRAAMGGRIAKLNVANGQRVKAKDVLVQMADLLDANDAERARELVHDIRELLEAGESRANVTQINALAQVPLQMGGSTLVTQRTGLSESLGNLAMALRTLTEVTPELVRADLSESGAAESKIKRIRDQKLELELSSELAELERTKARLDVSIRDRREAARRQVTSARSALELQLHAFEQALGAQAEDLQIVAPIDGVVSNLAVTGPEEIVQAGATLFQIIPDGGRLIAEVEIANKDIAELHVGMPVALKLDAYPFQDFGTLAGTLRELPQDVSATAPGAPPNYVVLVDLASETLSNRGVEKPVKLGMTLSANVEIRRRTLLELAIIEILKLKDAI
ncbi:MAG: HlyD family efflux transporter periplasmic adaptor subunit [Deltaproteobacteria bacterium]|nr:HlyD family efflux transporter periplasmic adaptor subunit [Deltaproteobacteria bacterium]